MKTNYRTVAYHNWAHGFHVCNSIYSILKASPGIYTPYEVLKTLKYEWKINIFIKCLGLWIGAICHDLDHRGFNNKFMIDIGSPLAAVYTTSTMENHHFSMGVSILQQAILIGIFLIYFMANISGAKQSTRESEPRWV